MLLLVGVVLGGDACAFNAYGEVALKKRSQAKGGLETDTLLSERGTIKAERFMPVATDSADRITVTWMLPTGSACPLVEQRPAREEAIARAAVIVRELLPELRQRIDVKAYVAPMFVRLRHKAGFDLASDRLAMEFGMSVPCGSDSVSADMLSALLHELTHIRHWSHRSPNRLSNEAIAYSVHSAAWWRIRGRPPDFRAFPHRENKPRSGQPWSRLFRGEPLSDRAVRIAQFALASLPADPGSPVAGPDTVAAYVRCLLDELPDFKQANPAAIFAETRGAHCSPTRKRKDTLAGP